MDGLRWAIVMWLSLFGAGSSWAQPLLSGTPVSAGGSQLRQETATQAIDLVTRVHGAEHRALVVAALGFALVALVLWRTRWVRRVWLHWAALVAVPVMAAAAWMGWAAAALGEEVRGLPLATLDDIRSDPTLSSFAGAVGIARDLCLASEHGALITALAFQPALEALAIAVVLALGVWGWTNRRVLRAA